MSLTRVHLKKIKKITKWHVAVTVHIR